MERGYIFGLAALAVAGLVLSAVIVNAGLDQARSRAAEGGTDLTLALVRGAVEAGLSLGRKLEDIHVVQDVIERERANAPEVLAIEVFGPSARAVYATDRGSLGERAPQRWVEAMRRRDAAGRWRLEEGDVLVVGEPVRNDFGEAVAEVAVSLSVRARRAEAEALRLELALWAPGFALAAAAAAAATGVAALRLATRDFAAVPAALSDPLRSTPGTGRGGVPAAARTGLAAAALRHRLALATDIARLTSAAAAVAALDAADEERPVREPAADA